MSRLSLSRTFVVAPDVSEQNGIKVKILSDLSGLKLHRYKPQNDPKDLPAALKYVIERIGKQITDSGKRPDNSLCIKSGPTHVTNVGQTIKDLVMRSQQRQTETTITHIGLDMEIVWRTAYDMFLQNPSIEQLTWKALMIDPDSSAIQAMASSTVSPDTARLKQKEMIETLGKVEKKMGKRKVVFICRAYSPIPILHGFNINDESLLMSLCQVEDGDLVGSPNLYLEFDNKPGSDTAEYFFQVFRGWFDHLWAGAKPVWPPES